MSAVIQETLLNFRPMIESDMDEIMLIENAVYEFPWTRVIFQDCLRVGYSCWVLEEDDDILAYGVMTIAVGECHILNLCVHKKFQNNGYGRIMLEYLLDQSRRHNAEVAFLEVRPSNEAAIYLYTQSGFNEVGMRRNYYPSSRGREDAIIMAYTLA
jgi:ribosomal-protein-alanine N-acetyltransferase